MGIIKKSYKLAENDSVSKVELPVNKYYLSVSDKFRICKFISIALLVLFVVGMISVYRDEITVENLKYFIKYLDTSSNEYTGGYKDINYNNTSVLKTGMFKGDYVVVNDETVTLYTMYGISSYSSNHHCSNPCLDISNKYYIVYDISGNNYSVYNAFSQIFSDTMDYPISGAAIADNGMYAIVSKTEDYLSAVYLYDENFNLVSRILKEKYILDIDFSDDGNYLVIVSVYDDDGEWCTELVTLDPRSDTESSKIVLSDEIGISSNINNDGTYSILSGSSMLFFDSDSNKINEYSFGTKTPFLCEYTEDYTVLGFNNNILGNEETIKVFDNQGELIYENVFEGRIADISCDGNYIYIIVGADIYRCDIKNNIEVKADGDINCKSLIPVNEYLLMVFSSYTRPVFISDMFE